MHIRAATNEDCFKIYELHISSIMHYCSDSYPANAISAWVELKSPEEYKNQENKVIIVAEEEGEIIGFGMLNLFKKKIEGLYLKPYQSGKGKGMALLKKLEEIAQKNNVNILHVSSTINAIKFYHQMGYKGDDITPFKLSSGINLNCVEMKKELDLKSAHQSSGLV